MPRIRDLIRIRDPKPLLDWVTEPPIDGMYLTDHAIERLQERGIGVFEVYCALADPERIKATGQNAGTTVREYLRGDIGVVFDEKDNGVMTVIDLYEDVRTIPRKPLTPNTPEGTIPTQPVPTTQEPEKTTGNGKNGQLDATRAHIHATKEFGEKFSADQIIEEMLGKGYEFTADGIRRSVWLLSRKGDIIKSTIGRGEYVYHLPHPVASRSVPKQTRSGTLVEQAREILYEFLGTLTYTDRFTVSGFMEERPEVRTLGSGQVGGQVVREAEDQGLLFKTDDLRPYSYMLSPAWRIVDGVPEIIPDTETPVTDETDTWPEDTPEPLEAMVAVHPSQNGYTPTPTVAGELMSELLSPQTLIIRSDRLPGSGEWIEVASFVVDRDVEIDMEQLARTGRVFLVARRKTTDGE